MLQDWLIPFLADRLIFIMAVLAVVWMASHGIQALRMVVASTLLAYFAGWLVKSFFYLPRPFIVAQTKPLITFLLDGSFPSSHTAVAFAMSGAVYAVNRRAGLVMFGLSVLVATARIAAGVHTPADVMGGVLVGSAAALFLTSRHFNH